MSSGIGAIAAESKIASQRDRIDGKFPLADPEGYIA